MKIVDLQQFRDLPSGTIFRKYEPDFFGAVEIKGENLESDFLSQELIDYESEDSGDYFDKMEKMTKGIPVPISFDNFGRDGLYQKDQMFLILEKDDLVRLHQFIGAVLCDL